MSESARSFAVRVSLYYAAIFANLGVYLPFLPIWLAWRGMTPAEIGMITSAPLFARVLATPSIGLWSDRRGNHRLTIIIGGWIGCICAVFLASAASFWPILLLVVGFQIATQAILPLVEAKVMSGVRRHAVDYGRMRLWGSAAFIVANVLGGLVIASYGGPSVLVMVIATVCATALAAHALPKDPPRQIHPAGAGLGSQQPGSMKELWHLATRPWFVLTMIAAGCIQGSHAVYYAFSAIHWRGLGITDGWIGLLWALGVAAEIALFSVSGKALTRFGATGLLLIGGLGGLVRWTAMAFDPPFWLLFPLQCLHALTFGATYLGALNLIQSRVPEHRTGSAQSIHAALASGIVMGVVTMVAGQIYGPLGAGSFLVMSLIAALGIIAAVYLHRLPAADQS